MVLAKRILAALVFLILPLSAQAANYTIPWNASSTSGTILTQPGTFNGTLTIPYAPYYIASSTKPSILPYASSTAITINGATYLAGLSNGCLQVASGLVTSSGISCGSGGGSGAGTISTSSTPTRGQIAVFSSSGAYPETQYSVATGTVASSGMISVTAGQSIIGSGLTIGCPTCSPFPFTPVTGGNSTSTLLYLYGGLYTLGSSTIQFASSTAITTANLYIGNLTGPLQAISGTVSATSTLSTFYGGTGLNSVGASSTVLVTNGIKAFWQKLATSQLTNDSGFLTNANAVTSVATNNGLTGGTITNTGTLGLDLTQISNGALLQYNGSRLAATGTPALTVGYIIATSTTATSTFANGIALTGGCFRDIAGVCMTTNTGTVTSVATNAGLTGGTITTTGTLGLDTTAISNSALLTYNGTRLAATGTPALTAGYFIATSTTASQLQSASTTALSVLGPQGRGIIPPFFTFVVRAASTSTIPLFGTTTLYAGPAMGDITVDGVRCETDTGTVGVSLYDGTNRANYIPTASTTINFNAYTTNNTFTKGESIRVDMGNPASSALQAVCRFQARYTAL